MTQEGGGGEAGVLLLGSPDCVYLRRGVRESQYGESADPGEKLL